MDLKLELKNRFGFDSFRGEQELIIRHAMEGKSALVIMPTGAGKSLCYQLPSLILSQADQGMVIVVSPLIALMQDQVKAARELGLRSDFISSLQAPEERNARYARLARGEYQLLFVTPERFRKTEFRESCSKNKIGLLAIDEAHCISLWGHDFRPDYSRLGEIRQFLGNPPTLALTATATPQVQNDILKQLNLSEAHRFLGGIERANLSLNVHEVYGLDEKIRSLVALRHQVSGSMIVYTSLIATLEKMGSELAKLNIEILKYHGQMAADQRTRAQRRFIEGDNVLLLATPAFGLGINKPDIRAVIHAEIPSSIESYYQEVGRAGRDGKPAEGHLLLDDDDVSIQTDFIKWSNPDPGFVKTVYSLLKTNHAQYVSGGNEYLRGQMNFYNSRDFRVETSLNILERLDLLDWDNRLQRFSVSGDLDLKSLSEEQNKLRIKTQNEKLLAILQFAQLEEGCRLLTVYQYFGVKKSLPCGVCDLCRK